MAQRKKPEKEVSLPPMLVEPREEARKKLLDRIQKGEALLERQFQTREEFEHAESLKGKWSEYNKELLTRLFDNDSIVKEYTNHGFAFGFIGGGNYSFHDEVKDFRESISRKINKLESIVERLDIIPENTPATAQPLVTVSSDTANSTNDIFIVHGQDDGAKETLARFISKFALNPIILHEQANEGKTIIEKFETHASSAGYAIVLMTPDDIGHIKDKPEQAKARARQNVIFELGYFIGKLSRKKVCALFKEGAEIPSDYSGVVFIPMDAGGAWRYLLAKELKSAGYQIDMNLLIN